LTGRTSNPCALNKSRSAAVYLDSPLEAGNDTPEIVETQ